MNFRDLMLYKWYIVGALVIAFVARYIIISQDIISTVAVTAAVSIVIILALSSRTLAGQPEILWNEPMGVMVILRPWIVEVSAARLITSVPLGIDLEHSAVKTLRALHRITREAQNASVKFFVLRPHGDGTTRIGMMVTRRGIRFHNGVAKANVLAKSVSEYAAVLEGALRAAYPHVPVVRAGLAELLGVYSGGVYGVA
ncbi:MAG: hypothetical protein ACTSYL_08780 [Candidatus Thorarchaeota archaeon]